MIYLDNSATTKPHPEVVKSFHHVSERFFPNPSSIHQLGGEAEQLLIAAKGQAAELLDVQQSEVIFTSGGTEGNNLAIKGIALQYRQRGKHIIISEVEHPSVYEACQSLEELGFEITYLPVNQDGKVSINDVEASIREDTILISIMHVNNETGTIQPIEAIGSIARRYPKLFFHVDAVQGFGKVPLQIQNWGIDLCTISGHKLHGMKGTGLLYVRDGIKLFPLFHGGQQENGKRAGTENLPGIISLVKAMRLIKEREMSDSDKLQALGQALRCGLDKLHTVRINTPQNGAAPHIMNFSVPGFKPEVIIHALGEKDIFISTKSACSSKRMNGSRILEAAGLSEVLSRSALRVSMSYDTTIDEVNAFLRAIETAIYQLKDVMR
ncbi:MULTISPECIES: cysteine desulfurase family protein [unclassified Virgibacillus]|uniref:cysteine desulfurase family protein n=1 Tax=unclassified Virgibacillus TaxID=2620237 RepID=UPI0024DE9606|nr:cysteine desulfurase family protein [Virgibacillus sp. LDC-1]